MRFASIGSGSEGNGLVVEAGNTRVLIDCGFGVKDTVARLARVGLTPESLTAILVTHEHADHVGGFALFIEKIWLFGRRDPIPVYGIESAIAQARRAWECFDTKSWKGVPEIRWHRVKHEPGAEVLRNERWRVTASPGIHPVPVVGIRVEAADGGVVAYSCDTDPSPEITKLATGVDILVHEGQKQSTPGVHSTYEQAAEVAVACGARRLVLVHLPPGVVVDDLAEARKIFEQIELGHDGARYAF